ncbi:alpha/beta hydrolase fold domain-containing protein [Mycobacterium sp. 1245805.9]|uniref:alpha/beta hydrolase fold domain-containing protein n=1 Tax=Mycobacterium sp. 1245805.9 TaxID=1856862 RepID=UPI0007FDD348|nr:alpha/beta hydrolase fold domain-containing protein [Mycobacterium sp. 1245805.9]OBI90676.1 esterase [Mycobacterium sp. 1245805.9]
MSLSWRSRALPAVIALTRARAYRSAQTAREHIDRRAAHPQFYGPPPGLRKDVNLHLDRESVWPIYTLTAQSLREPQRTVVYLHGGAWVNEIASQHWRLAVQIAADALVRVVVPIYPLVPFATAAEVVPRLAELVSEKATPDHSVCLAGDSAGGQLALSAALLLRDEHRLVLPETVLISPVLDVSLTNPLIDAVDDPWLTRVGLLEFARRWCGDVPVTDPMVSPLNADLSGLGPLTVFSGTRDILNPDARLLAEKAAAAGVRIDYHEQPGLVHVYPLTPTPEGRAARALIVEQLRAN